HRTRRPCENHNPGRVDDQRHLRSLEGQPATNDGDERGRPALGQASGVRALPPGRLSVARWRPTSTMSRIADAVRTASRVRDGSQAPIKAGVRMSSSAPKLAFADVASPRFFDMVGAAGSIPVAPTIVFRLP